MRLDLVQRWHRAAGPRGGRRMRGVSLLEMLLVVALMALVGVLAAAAMNGGIDGMRLRSAARQIAAELRFARTQALASGQLQQFAIDPRTHRWEGANGHHGQVPQALAIRFTGAREVQPRAGIGAIRFFEDGASSGGRIELQARQAVWRIDVAWMTGEVRAGRVEAP